MNTEEQIAKLKSEIEQVVAEEEKLQDDRWDKLKNLALLTRRLIKEEKLLGQCEWTLITRLDGFTICSSTDDTGIENIRRLIEECGNEQHYYHFDFKLLDDDGSIFFDDSEVRMYFDDMKSLSRICSEYGIKIYLDHLDKEIKENTDRANKYVEIKKVLESYGRD